MVDGADRGSAFRPALSKLRRLSLLGSKQAATNDDLQLKLNYDILLHVMLFLELGDLFRTMRTSRTLYELGLPILLANVQITRTNMAASLLYRRHLLQDTTRLSKVRSLCSTYKALDDGSQHPVGHRIYKTYQPFPQQYRLTDLLPQFTNLVVLEVAMEGAHVTPTFCDWIRTLKRLRVLKLRGVGAQAELLKALLPDLPPGMEAVHIARIKPRSVVDAEWNPLKMLAHSWATLESLAFEVYDRLRGPLLASYQPACLPAVRDLSWVSRNDVRPDVLMRTFPAVRTLRIGHVRLDTPGFGIGRNVDEAEQAQLRERNLRAQQVGTGWDSLERLEGGLLSLWTLALRCRVAHVETVLHAWPGANLGHLIVLLHETTPRRLTLTTYPVHLAQLGRVLNFGPLEDLELCVDVVSNGEPDILDILRNAFDEVYQSNLRRLTLIIRMLADVHQSAAYLRASRMGDLDLHRPPPSQSLSTRWRAFADSLFTMVPLLEHLKLEVWGSRTLICTRRNMAVVSRESTTEVCPWDPRYMDDEGVWPVLRGQTQ